MAGKSINKYVVMGQGRIDGKAHVWIAGVFNSVKEAKPWVALLKLARAANDVATVVKMDAHAPEAPDGKELTAVKYSGSVIQYNPEVSGLDDDALLG